MLINDLYTNKKPSVAEAIGDLGSNRDRGKSIRKWRKQRGLDEQGVAEGVNHSALQGWDEMTRDQKSDALVKAGITDNYNTIGKTPDQLDDILHAARVKAQNQEDELSMGAGGRRELQRQAKQDFEEQRQQLHKEKMEMERFAWEKANTEAERKHEMAKIDKQYTQELRTLQMSHMQDMEKILHADTHELNKMKAEFNMRQAEREKAKPEPELQDEPAPQPSPQANFDPDTGEPIRPQANQWHTSQQVGYKPTKPIDNDDIVDVEPKPNKPLALKEKVSIVRDPAQATGIQRTGGITAGSVYMPGKPRPQSVPQNTGAVASSKPSAMNSQKPLMAVSFDRWKQAVLNRYPEARFATQKMINGATIATDRSGQVGIYDPKNSYAKVGSETQKVAAKGSLAEEASPMIKPPANRFDNKQQAFDHAKQHGGKVFKSTYIDPNTGSKNMVFVVKKDQGMAEASLGDYGKKAMMSRAMAQTNKFFDRDDPAKVAAADKTIAKRERGLARADARRQPYSPPEHDAEKYQRDLTAQYPNIDELVAKAEQRRDPNYDRAEGNAYYNGRDAEQHYQKLKQIQRVIQGLNESLNRSHLP